MKKKTAHYIESMSAPQFLLPAFQHHGIAYLLKPFDYAQFQLDDYGERPHGCSFRDYSGAVRVFRFGGLGQVAETVIC